MESDPPPLVEDREYIIPIVRTQHGSIKIRAVSDEDAREKLGKLSNKRLSQFFQVDCEFVKRGQPKENELSGR